MADFAEHTEEFRRRDVALLALSVDPRDEAEKTVARHDLTLPVGWGVDAERFAAATGAFFDRDRGILEAAGFVLDPEGRVAAAVYSTGPVGRYTAEDVLGLVDYLAKERRKASTEG